MGKHKEKKHKKHKKKHRNKSKNRSRSPSPSSSSSNEWVEKRPEDEEDNSPKTLLSNDDYPKRDEWMSLPTIFASTSTLDSRSEREANKRLEKERAMYNPRESSRELNPYWKSGGDGLPTFQKPSEDESYNTSSNLAKKPSSNWRKKPIEAGNDFIFTNQEEAYQETRSALISKGELNALAAKLVKAEIMGNTALIAELKDKLEKARANVSEDSSSEREVLLTQTDSKGFSRPVRLQSECGEYSGGKHKKRKVETHSSGERIRYFPDDDKQSLQQMFEQEKYNSAEQSEKQFMQMAGRIHKNDDLDDVFTDNIRKGNDARENKQVKERAVSEHQQMTQALDTCLYCLQSDKMAKHLMVTMTEAVYLILPHFEPLTSGHCLLAPIRHASCSTQLDENEWAEIINFRRALISMFSAKNEDVIFFETAMFLHRHPHMVMHCVPLPKEQGDLAPIYFKKAIDESEHEWAMNKKLVSLTGRDVRRAIPKSLPYFAVYFGMDDGFAHVIEDQRTFPVNFAQEIIGGILDLEHSKWRKPKVQKFEEQRARVQEFSKEWNAYSNI